MMRRSCSIPGCIRPHRAHGWCNAHHRRWQRHGDPLAGGTSPGAPERFYQDVVLNHDGDDCLIWPFAKGGDGYGQMYLPGQDGKKVYVHRRLCEEVNGPPPNDRYDTAHSCGRGQKGCVSKRHLSWKTRAENLADRVVHRTDQRGERAPMNILTEAQAREIFREKGRVSQRELARKFGVSKSNISAIQRRKSWRHVDMEAGVND